MFKYSLIMILSTSLALAVHGRTATPTGSFIQLNRALAARTTAEWRRDMEKMRQIGIRSLLVQWSAEPDISYLILISDPLTYSEQYRALERILSAAEETDMQVHLGLFHDPDYWTAITARDPVLRDYFLVSAARHETLQKALLERFGPHPAWVGYYIPEEIDDLSWREPQRAARFNQYLALLCERLRANDPERSIRVSAFFRSRTAPAVFRDTLLRIVENSGLDGVLLQDGTGTGDPHEPYLPFYYKVLTESWPANAPRLSCVIEVFEQTSVEDAPFTAKPAPSERVRRQMEHAARFFDKLILFTFTDYADPDLGPEARALYELFSEP